MRNLVKTDFDAIYEDLSNLYEDDSQHKPAEYMSPMLEEFIKKVEAIANSFGCSLENSKFTIRGEWQTRVDLSGLSDSERQAFRFKLDELKANGYSKLQIYNPKENGQKNADA